MNEQSGYQTSDYIEDGKEFLREAWSMLGIGEPTWWSVLIVGILFLCGLLLLRKLLRAFLFSFPESRGSSGGYSGFSVVPPAEKPKLKTGFEQVDPRIYDFTVKTPKPNLSSLRDDINLDRLKKPLTLDMDMAERLFVPRRRK